MCKFNHGEHGAGAESTEENIVKIQFASERGVYFTKKATNNNSTLKNKGNMKKLILIAVVCLSGFSAYAQIESPVKWSYGAKKISSTEAVVFLRATIQDGWHIYSQNVKDGGPIKTSFTFDPSQDYAPIGATSEPTAITKYESAFSMNVSYFEKTVTFQQKIKLKSPNVSVIKGKLEYMTCNDKKCLPPEDLDFAVNLGK